MEIQNKGEKYDLNTLKTITGRLNEAEIISKPKNLFFENRIDCEWLTTKEAAHYLSVSPNALRIMVYRGQITVYKFGRRLRFKSKDCRALFQKKGA